MIHTDGARTIAHAPAGCCAQKDKRPWRVRELTRSLMRQGHSQELAEHVATKVVYAKVVA